MMRSEFLYCTTSCGHNFLTHLDKKVGSIGNCDKCEGYAETMIIKVEVFAN